MTGNEVVNSYLQISDVMYEALKTRKYDIFEDALQQREELIQHIVGNDGIFSSATQEQKSYWQSEISSVDEKLQFEMENYRKSMEDELYELKKGQGKIRKQESINRYSSSQEQGVKFDKMK